MKIRSQSWTHGQNAHTWNEEWRLHGQLKFQEPDRIGTQSGIKESVEREACAKSEAVNESCAESVNFRAVQVSHLASHLLSQASRSSSQVPSLKL